MYGLMNLNYLNEQSRQSARWTRTAQPMIGESDMAFANFIARHFAAPIRKADEGDLLFFREVLGIDLAGTELRPVA